MRVPRYLFLALYMSVTLEVGLLSGKSVTVLAGLDETVETLKNRAQMAQLPNPLDEHS